MISIPVDTASVFSEENILEAIIHLKDTKDVCDQNGLRPSLLVDYWKNNRDTIINAVNNCCYRPFPVKQFEKLSKSGKKRTLSFMSLADRMIARAIQQVLTPAFEMYFSSRCYSYRNGTGTKDLALFACERIKEGYDWVLEFDIEDFFDSIPLDALITKLDSIITDKKLMALMETFIRCPVSFNGKTIDREKGILQGIPLSPLLSNIFLMELDNEFSEQYPGYCRFGDDIRILSKSKNELENAYQRLRQEISVLGLYPNNKKCGIHPSINRKYVGYEFRKVDNDILICPVVRNSHEIYNRWQTSEIKEVSNHYHVITDGVLSKQDFTLLFENENEKKYIPIEKIDTLNIYSNVIFGTNFFEYLSNEKVTLNIVDKFGNSTGTFIPVNQKRNIKTEIAQISIITDEKKRLKLAKELEKANLFNIRAVLRYYKRRTDNDLIDETVISISDLLKKVNKTKNVDELMILEAQARQKYYQCFNEIIHNPDFLFKTRTKRPPKDPINAMISYGNTLLYSRIAHEIRKTDLDVRIGIIHSAYKRSENLNLDLADIFKPIIIDRVIFTLINRNMVNISDFEENGDGGVYMSRKAKYEFISEFNRKLEQKIMIDNKQVTYSELIVLEVKKIRNRFLKEEDYKAFRYIN